MPKLTPVNDQTTPAFSVLVSLRDMSREGGHEFDISPDISVREGIALELGMLKLRKLRFHGALTATARSDWQLGAILGATLEQACVITNQPVVTRIDAPVSRLFLASFPAAPTASEAEFDGQDEVEPLQPHIDLGAVMLEALALAMPDYPRAPGAELIESRVAPPGSTPIEDADTKPFAALASLRDKIGK